MHPVVVKLLRLWGSPRVKRAVNLVSVLFALGVSVLAFEHFRSTGWPLRGANAWLVAASVALFLVAYAAKAFGWQRLFAPDERPCPSALAAAGGAACVTGVALPGRFDEAVRVAVARRHPGCRAGVKPLLLSLFVLGLVDAVALSPLASVGAAFAGGSNAVRVGLSLVALAGMAAAVVVVALPRLMGMRRLVRFRLVRWLGEHAPSTREASKAVALVTVSWLARGTAFLLLLAALGLGFSIPLAIIALTAGAASAALPIAPAGAATQAGAGAAVLIACGVRTESALSFALASQVLLILAGAAVVLSVAGWQAGRRLVAVRAT